MSGDSATLFFNGEDHTLGVLLREQLLKDKTVLFVAYKVPHPLTHCVQVHVQTLQGSVVETTTKAVQVLQAKVNDFSTAFKEAYGNLLG